LDQIFEPLQTETADIDLALDVHDLLRKRREVGELLSVTLLYRLAPPIVLRFGTAQTLHDENYPSASPTVKSDRAVQINFAMTKSKISFCANAKNSIRDC